jgi:hypothetical protein
LGFAPYVKEVVGAELVGGGKVKAVAEELKAVCVVAVPGDGRRKGVRCI